MHGPKENRFPGQETPAETSGTSVGRASAIYPGSHCPRLMERRATWWSSKGLSADSSAFRFATRCRVHTGQRQRKEKRSHAITTPSRFGCRLREPVYDTEPLRRTRQKTAGLPGQCLRRPPYLRTGGCTFRIRRFVPASFLLTGRSRFLFDVSKRKWGRILPGSPVLPAGGRPKLLPGVGQPPFQSGIPLLAAVVFRHRPDSGVVPHYDQQLPGPGKGRIEHAPHHQ